jgi:hypothetical protein
MSSCIKFKFRANYVSVPLRSEMFDDLGNDGDDGSRISLSLNT